MAKYKSKTEEMYEEKYREQTARTLGIVSIATAWFGPFAALVIAIVGLTKARKTSNVTLGILGILFSCISFVINLIYIALFL